MSPALGAAELPPAADQQSVAQEGPARLARRRRGSGASNEPQRTRGGQEQGHLPLQAQRRGAVGVGRAGLKMKGGEQQEKNGEFHGENGEINHGFWAGY